MYDDKKPTVEAGKELLRLVVFWVASTLVTAALAQVAHWNLPPMTAEVLTALLRTVDKWIHEKDTGRFADLKGLLPF